MYILVFYGTTWVSQIVKQSSDVDNAQALRLGSLAMLYHAVVALVCTLILPWALSLYKRVVHGRQSDSLASLWATTIFVLSFSLLATWVATRTSTATIVVAITGLPLALTSWAPFALLGIVVRKQDDQDRSDVYSLARTESGSSQGRAGPVAVAHEAADEQPLLQRQDALEAGDEPVMEEHRDMESASPNGNPTALTSTASGGTILGLHNVSLMRSAFFLLDHFHVD